MITIDDSSAGQRVQSRPRDEKKQSTEATNVGKKTAPMDTSLEPPAPPSTKATASGTPTQGGGASTSASTNNPPATNTTTGEDIYEFKSVKESTSPTDTTKSTDPEPQSEDPLNATNPPEEPSSNNKRTFNDLTDPDTNEPNDEDSRRKKRKDSDSGKTNSQPTRNPNQSNKISAKPNALKPNSIERKSPIPSPKSSTSTAADQDDDAKPDLKVPPLKIVIPQSSTTGEQETGGNRNGKSSSQRAHHAALPYVVPSSNDATGTPGDKEQTNNPVGVNTVGNEGSGGSVGQGSGGAPGASTAGKDDKKEAVGAAGDDQKSSGHHQRVLRSSHRSAGGGTTGGGQPTNSTTTDRSSNNSSPLLQQRSHSPSPNSSPAASTSTTSTVPTSTASGPSNPAQPEQNRDPPPAQATTVKTTPNEPQTSTNTTDTDSNGSSTAAPTAVPAQSGNTTAASTTNPTNVELHPRKRKMRPNKEQTAQSSSTQNDGSSSSSSTSSGTGPEKGPGNGNNTSGSADSTAAADVHPHDQPITNCYQLFLNIRKQIERRRKSLFPVQPKPPQGFKDYLMNRCTYVLAGTAPTVPNINPPTSLPAQMRDIFGEQERERYRLRMQHVIEKEKLVLSVEQEILRVHGRAARALANQSLPFSVCTVLRDDEVYNIITPEQEEKDRNARSRYNGRLFLSWLQDVDDKWEKIKEHMLLRHHNEAESLHAVQKMDWEWKLKELSLCEYKATPQIDEVHVPMVHVSDDFDLLPA